VRVRRLALYLAVPLALTAAACQSTSQPAAGDAAAAAAADTGEVAAGATLSADEVAVLIPGRTFAWRSTNGTWEGVVTFEPDGRETGTWRNIEDGRSGPIEGTTWELSGDMKCTTRPSGATECYRYARDGDRLLELSADTGEVLTIWEPVV